jgi:hypothetical protein
MSDHNELADQREEEADKLERESERIGEGTDAARDAVKRSQQDELVPAPLGEDDPARREGERVPGDDAPPAEDEDDPARPNA